MSLESWFSDFGSGLLEGATKPETILGTVGLFVNNQRQNEASDLAKQNAQTQFDQSVSLLNLKHQQELETLREKAALSGGGGGGGGSAAGIALANAELALKRKELAQQKALAKYQAMQEARQFQINSTLNSADLKQRAMQNLLQAATAPLGRF